MRLGLNLGTQAVLLFAFTAIGSAQATPSGTQAPSPVSDLPPAPPPGSTGPVAPGPAAAADQSCVPQCRSGYLCQAGVCVSACNPPCPAGTMCTGAGGECVASAQPPVPPPPPPP